MKKHTYVKQGRDTTKNEHASLTLYSILPALDYLACVSHGYFGFLTHEAKDNTK